MRKQYGWGVRGWGASQNNAYNDLVKLSTWFIDPARPQGVKGTADAFNTAQVNPLQDQRGVVGKNLAQQFRDYVCVSGVPFDSGFIPIKLGGRQITFDAWIDNGATRATGDGTLSLRFFNASFVQVDFWSMGPFPRTVNNPVGSEATIVYYKVSGTPSVTQTIKAFQILDGATPLPFEPYGKANVLMTNVAWTTLDGFRAETAPNGKTVIGFKGDSADTYGAMATNAPNPVGTVNFSIARTFRTASTLVTQYFFTRAEQSEATCQIGIKLTNTGILSVILNGTSIQIATGIAINSWYDLVIKRNGGTLTALLNGVQVLSVANSTSLTTRPNARLGALSNNVGGTTHTGFFNVTMFNYGYTEGDADKVNKFESTWRKNATKEFGL
jgi:hypothetical protein